MKTELIMKSDVLDIIFENRNKAYGAYSLRKFYKNRLLKSLSLMLAGVIVLSAFTFMPKHQKITVDETFTTVPQELGNVKDKPKEYEKPKVQIQPKKNNALAVQFSTNIKIVPASVDVKPFDEITDTTQIAAVASAGTPGGQPAVGTVPNGSGDGETGKGKEPVPEPTVDIVTPTAAPDVMPEYPGGIAALRKFLQRNLNNPRDMEEGEQVSVKVRFVVGFDGKLKSFEVAEDGGDEFNKEVIRVLKKMPEWVPGKTRGQNVSVYYTIPVKFVPAE